MKQLLNFVLQMPPRARWTLGVGAIAVVIVTGGLLWWLTKPVYSPLFQDLDAQDMSQIVTTLQQWHVDYRYGSDSHSILVPSSDVMNTRMRLAGQGVPAHGTVGLEIFDNADYGMTEFAQKVNYQRAIQGELERTIMSLKEVKFARVHLTMKHSDLFLKDEEPPKASVTLATRDQEHLTPQQISGIQNLVAAAVEGLDANAVVLVDDRGNPLTGTDGALMGASNLDSRLQEEAKIESNLKRRISDLLINSLGLRKASVSVNVALNFDQVKHTSEQVLTGPDGKGFVVHKQESRSAPTSGQAALAKSGRQELATTSDTEYENGKSYEEVEYARGRVQRITVGIIVPAAMSAEEQTRLRQVIAAAVGLDLARGDQIQLAALLPAKSATQTSNASMSAVQPAASAVSVTATAKQPAMAKQSLISPKAFKWGAVILLLAALAILALLTLLGRKNRMSPAQKANVLRDIRHWLGETGG